MVSKVQPGQEALGRMGMYRAFAKLGTLKESYAGKFALAAFVGILIPLATFIVFLMLIVLVAGIGSYFSLGRAEDPAFSVKTMVVSAGWPGATLDDTLQQVTERLERKLQETPHLDYLRSYTTPGQTTIFEVDLKDVRRGKAVDPPLLPNDVVSVSRRLF